MKIEKILNLRELRKKLRETENKLIELLFILLEKETELPIEIQELWDINDEIYKTFPDIPYSEVLEEIKYRQKEMKKLKPYEDDATAMYNMFADLHDEDFAIAELEDFNLI